MGRWWGIVLQLGSLCWCYSRWCHGRVRGSMHSMSRRSGRRSGRTLRQLLGRGSQRGPIGRVFAIFNALLGRTCWQQNGSNALGSFMNKFGCLGTACFILRYTCFNKSGISSFLQGIVKLVKDAFYKVNNRYKRRQWYAQGRPVNVVSISVSHLVRFGQDTFLDSICPLLQSYLTTQRVLCSMYAIPTLINDNNKIFKLRNKNLKDKQSNQNLRLPIKLRLQLSDMRFALVAVALKSQCIVELIINISFCWCVNLRDSTFFIYRAASVGSRFIANI